MTPAAHKKALMHIQKSIHHATKSHEALGTIKHIKSAEKFEKKYRGKAKKAKVG